MYMYAAVDLHVRIYRFCIYSTGIECIDNGLGFIYYYSRHLFIKSGITANTICTLRTMAFNAHSEERVYVRYESEIYMYMYSRGTEVAVTSPQTISQALLAPLTHPF